MPAKASKTSSGPGNSNKLAPQDNAKSKRQAAKGPNANKENINIDDLQKQVNELKGNVPPVTIPLLLIIDSSAQRS